MAEREIHTVWYVRQALDYDPHSGEFSWRPRPLEHFPDTRAWRIWNTRYAGKKTGCNSHGYRILVIGNKHYPAHRVAWCWMTGSWPKDQIDHINGVRSDNRWANLREATSAENHQNRSIVSNNSSGILGVSWNTRERMWAAQIHVEGKVRFLGYFHERESAKEKYLKAKSELHVFCPVPRDIAG